MASFERGALFVYQLTTDGRAPARMNRYLPENILDTR